MKKILYILNDNARRFTYARSAGLYRAMQKAGEPVNLYIVRSDGHSSFSPNHNHGEYNIFHLPDYGKFDAIILDVNSNFSTGVNIFSAKGAMYAIEAAAASGKPVFSIANDIPGFYYVGIDNHAAMTSVIRYLHQEQGLTDFWFAMGPADNYENQTRSQALRDYCASYGLPCEESRFHNESFMMESGWNAFERLLSLHGGRLPQAVICANDLNAIGVCKAAQAAGFRVPRDLKIAGFDNIHVSAYLSPSITTVDQLCWNLGDALMDVISRAWRGEEIPRRTFLPTELVLRESTGSFDARQSEMKRLAGKLIIEDFEMDDFSYALSSMQHQLPGSRSIEDICRALIRCVASLGCKGARLVLDRDLFEYRSLAQFNEQDGRSPDVSGRMLVDGYSDRMEAVFTWEAGKEPLFQRRAVSARLPLSEYPGPNENHLFIPLHFMEYTVGYLSIWNCLDMMRIKCLTSVSNTLSMALSGYFTRRNLSHVNHLLSGISMKDDLTGLYNRLGYHDLVYPLYRRQCENGGRLGILFIDMDSLKYLNDTYGHETGDLAIKSLADAILTTVPEEAIPVRYGGDEFLVFLPAHSMEDMKDVLSNISAALVREAGTHGIPQALSVSYGIVLTDPEAGKSLGEYVKEADALMYQQKKAKKISRENGQPLSQKTEG